MRAFLLMVLALGSMSASAATVESFVTYDHTSALSRGVPFNNQLENTQDFIGAGATITVGKNKRFEIDCSQGWKRINEASKEAPDGKFIEGTRISVRYYPGRNR